MENDIVLVGNSQMKIREVDNQRVVTFKDIDEVHQKKAGTAKQNFKRHKKRFIYGVDYKIIKPMGTDCPYRGFDSINSRGLTVFTESGYLMLVKSFDDDLAWNVQRQLVNTYFRVKQPDGIGDTMGRETALPLASDNWYLRNRGRIGYIIEQYDSTRRELYHYILRQLSKTYDVDAAKLLYEKETGHPIQYSIEVVNYFKEMGKEADKILDWLELQILKKD